MMRKLVAVNSDGELKIGFKNKVLDTVKRANTWYTSQRFTTATLLFLVIIDVFGFRQIATATMATSPANRFIIMSAFVVAFEVAPLYIGYAVCLKSYELGKQIHTIIFYLSLASFLLGIIANCIYRILTMRIAYWELSPDGKTQVQSSIALPMTILMIILPIITSLVNIVMGCLSFDPLLFEMLRLSKKLRVLKEKKRQFSSYIEEMQNDSSSESIILLNEDQNYNNTRNGWLIIQQRLKNYSIILSSDE